LGDPTRAVAGVALVVAAFAPVVERRYEWNSEVVTRSRHYDVTWFWDGEWSGFGVVPHVAMILLGLAALVLAWRTRERCEVACSRPSDSSWPCSSSSRGS